MSLSLFPSRELLVHREDLRTKQEILSRKQVSSLYHESRISTSKDLRGEAQSAVFYCSLCMLVLFLLFFYNFSNNIDVLVGEGN